ncbi:hypothetical protein SAMN05216371_6917 [Streptomyces sp. TLI_053]|uniref:DUF6571 family protein n=1 Tax=Streptomyces sp. TLI_053 TaxID=1855352 RepID=UPI000879F07D|nr:DUF6571 family protein [Streptomyces sp. TLI_053]SDT81989.1 hypothetical protein SAMN05216371_6917 [Streptomyces sp. TLI_053]
MVTYTQLQNVDLAGLNSAATDFEKMVRSWDLSTRIQNEVIGPVQQSGWHGPSSESAATALTQARDQIRAAFEEASAIARTLRDAHDEFTAAQKDLRTAVHNAAELGLTVDAQGNVHWPPATDPADKRDADYAKAQQANAQGAAQEIGKALDRATEADSAAALALAMDTGNDTKSFNSTPLGSVADAEAKQAAQILSLGSAASDTQLAQLQALLQHHSGDPRFATAFYGGQDPGTFLASYGSLAQSGDFSDSPARKAAVKGIQEGLGLTLATATSTGQQPHLPADWADRMRRAGSRHVQIAPGAAYDSSPYGYQILGNILKHGNYDAAFLKPIAEHVTQLTQENPARWDAVAMKGGAPFQEFWFTGTPDDKGNYHGFNPMGSVLNALGHSPDAAAKFFTDPPTTYWPDGSVKSTGGTNTYLTLLADTGERSLLRDVAYPLGPNSGRAGPLQVEALGHALEAGATGRAYDDETGPLPPHNKAMNQTMQQAVGLFGGKDASALLYGEDAPFGDLQGSLGKMTGAYMGDVQTALGGPSTRLPINGELAGLPKENLQHLLVTLGHNPEAYASVAAAQQAYTTAAINDVLLHPSDHGDLTSAALASAAPGGTVAGLLSRGMTDEVFTQGKNNDEEYNSAVSNTREWAGTIWETTAGSVLETRAPIVGPLANSMVDKIMDGIAESYLVNTEAETTNKAQAAQNHALVGAQGSVQDAIRDGAAQAGLERKYLNDMAPAVETAIAGSFAAGTNILWQVTHEKD